MNLHEVHVMNQIQTLFLRKLWDRLKSIILIDGNKESLLLL